MQREHGGHAAIPIDLVRRAGKPDVEIAQERPQGFFGQFGQSARYSAVAAKQAGGAVKRAKALGESVLRVLGIGVTMTERG